jgi:RpiB/LacA/LacB family sugar-phosphate isomerase
MNIAIGADHRGFKLKEEIKSFLLKMGHEVDDRGTDSEESVDYPDFGFPVAQAVASLEAERGILICATGMGMSIVANKVKGVRATLCTSERMAELSRAHNNSNLLTLGAANLPFDLSLRIVKVWLRARFEGGRHQRRLGKIEEYENG